MSSIAALVKEYRCTILSADHMKWRTLILVVFDIWVLPADR